jgi:hypothetical protein
MMAFSAEVSFFFGLAWPGLARAGLNVVRDEPRSFYGGYKDLDIRNNHA